MSDSPKKRFGLGEQFKDGSAANLTVFDLSESYEINSDDFLSKGKSSPFTGSKVFGKCLFTMYNGEAIWKDKNILSGGKING